MSTYTQVEQHHTTEPLCSNQQYFQFLFILKAKHNQPLGSQYNQSTQDYKVDATFFNLRQANHNHTP